MKIFIFILILPSLLSAYALPFLKEGAGARTEALGGAGIASASGADSIFLNPSSMLALSGPKNSVFLSYAKLDYDRAAGYAAAFERSEDLSTALGVFWAGRYSGGIEERDVLGLPGAMLSMSSGAAGLSGAFRLGTVKAGISVKYYYSMFSGTGAKGAGVDLAVSGNLFSPALVFGAAVNDLSAGLYWDTGRVDPLPLSVRAGICCKAIPERFEIAFDLEQLDGISLHAGAEYFIEKMLYVRSGLSKYGPSFGIGINCQKVGLDYAFLPDKNGFGAEHSFSVSFSY